MSLRIKILDGVTDESFAKVLEIRSQVFTEEQKIPSSLDDDGLDFEAIHVLAFLNEEAIGTGRIISRGYQAVIARIAVREPFRGNSYASLIVKALESEGRKKGCNSFELYPHIYLERFYSKLGYVIDRKYKNNVAGHDLIKMVKYYD